MENLMTDTTTETTHIELTTDIVSAYVSKNAVPVSELGALIASVSASLRDIAGGAEAATEPVAAPKPAVPIKKSITPDYLICLEDGMKFKTLKRPLMARYGLTPHEYRKKWNLPDNYPMVAPNYAARRSELAKGFGLGHWREPKTSLKR
jgi:predicted transcriptional regulator